MESFSNKSLYIKHRKISLIANITLLIFTLQLHFLIKNVRKIEKKNNPIHLKKERLATKTCKHNVSLSIIGKMKKLIRKVKKR